ncbi:MAG TPA: glycogen debranching N-terminal domain-containing protein, partial [Pseudonocardiaceae bacterium]|nr:glycogen debranching N-terminal domain-containing protein [Pseudonocardiaceae bacterium]
MDGDVTLVEGTTFCVCDEVGDVGPGGVQGLYVLDTRVLSAWRLRVDGRAVQPLTWFGAAPFRATFLGRAGSLLVRRDRQVGAGLREDLTLANHSAEATFAEVTIEVDADFADVFEVRAGALRGRGERTVRQQEHDLVYEYRWRDRARACRVRAGAEATVLPGVTVLPGATVLPGVLVFRALVPARGEWSASIGVSTGVDGEPLPPAFAPGEPVAEAAPVRRHERWLRDTPTIETADPQLRRTFERSRADLGSLRITDGGGGTAVAAGSPWYMTLFGRDSLLTAYLALPLDQALAVGTLRMLARHQGKTTDAATEEEPGKILHELRSGIDPSRYLGGGHAYYGTVDATPLFVVLVGELSRWGVDVEEFLPHVDRALQWLQTHDGFVSYRRRTDRGLVNQGWKDSWNGVNFADGRLARAPVALAEVQGYAYAAYLARAERAGPRGA